MGSVTTWVGKKPLRRIGGMSYALSIAADLGFSVPPPPPSQEELQNLSTGEKGDDLIKVLRELTTVQRKIADLQVELQGRKDHIIAQLQQPYSLDCIPVEAEYQVCRLFHPCKVYLLSRVKHKDLWNRVFRLNGSTPILKCLGEVVGVSNSITVVNFTKKTAQSLRVLFEGVDCSPDLEIESLVANI
ncbi:hypothetical protein SLEP1_g26357 [Rubroshorea leprosula]|uniref:Uncharacterized protein n=1 Tax=Rubroshorea leprosula TaxID=152421 RepID=A0AAV5JS77_9ROSI|nr:hypothetical protein SLEP1_g26357 [Rubroshorea leprosula]